MRCDSNHFLKKSPINKQEEVHLRKANSFSTFKNISMWCFCCWLTCVINVVLRLQMKHHHIVTITKSFTGFRVVFILCCMYPVYRLKARPLCSCDGRGGRLQLEPHSAFLYCCELKAWFLFFKAQWVKSIMFDDYRSVCLILCVLNKNAGLLVCMSAPLVLVCTNRRPFVGIWCLLASPMGIVWGFSKISRECVPHQREEVRNETLHLSRSSYTAKKMLLLNC